MPFSPSLNIFVFYQISTSFSICALLKFKARCLFAMGAAKQLTTCISISGFCLSEQLSVKL